jgi:hypothetical protein
MDTVIKAIGTVIVCIGLVYLIKPEILKGFMLFFSKGSRLYLAALVRFALAITFFLGASQCKIMWLITAFGAIFLLSGLLILILGLEKAKGIINWYLEQPTFMFRVIASIVMCVGFIIVFAA